MQNSPRVRSVSFSGVDGAGKTTQIENLCLFLTEQGITFQIFRFWDDVAKLTGVREGTGHRVFKGEKGIGRPDAPVNRRDKNVRGFPMTCIRLFLYSLDAISLRGVYKRAMQGDAQFVIFDRYTYDELANLDLENPVIRAFSGVIMRLVPRPDVSFLLDADPEAARARKPEYPIDFVRQNRRAYFDLNKTIGGLTVVPPSDIDIAKRHVLDAVAAILTRPEHKVEVQRGGSTETDPALS